MPRRLSGSNRKRQRTMVAGAPEAVNRRPPAPRGSITSSPLSMTKGPRSSLFDTQGTCRHDTNMPGLGLQFQAALLASASRNRRGLP